MKNILTLITILLSLALIAQPTDYVAYYPFNGNANDDSGNGNNGTVNGATLTTDRFGNADAAYSFDGIDDRMTISRTAFPNGLTINAWIKTNSADNSPAFSENAALSILGDVDGTVGVSFGITGGLVDYNHVSGAWQSLTGVTSIDDDIWHFISINHDAISGDIAVYVDGVLDVSGNIPYNTTDIFFNRIGSSFNVGVVDGDFFDGSIDDIRIYDRALSDVEIQQLFSSTSFITTWQTTTSSESITIPTASGEAYDYEVNWGDGTIESGFTGDASHTYTEAGTYTVSISGTFPNIYFGNAGDKDKIQTIEQWGDIVWNSMAAAFQGCTNLTYNATDAPDLSQVTDLSAMFHSASSFNGDISNWDVSGVTNMNSMFNAASMFNQDLNSWNVSNVTDMALMFSLASSFNGNIYSWDVSNVTTMGFMFDSAGDFNQDISGWNTSSLISIGSMFNSATSFNQDIGGWDVSNVLGFGAVLRDASAFDQDLGAWDISNATSLSSALDNTNMSSSNYDATLIGWATLDAGETQIPTNISLDATGVEYCEGVVARQALIDTYTWTITDAGQNCTDLVAWYTFSGDATDNSGNGNDGTLGDGVTSSTFPTLVSDRFGNADQAYSFDGVDDNIFVGESSNLDLSSFTIHSWIKTSQTPASFRRIVIKPSAGQQNYSLAVNNGKPHVRFDGSNPAQAEDTEDINDGEWHQLVGIFDNDADIISIYIDGVLKDQNSTSETPQLDDLGLYIGGRTGFAQFFEGSIDDIRIYNRALSDTEVLNLYNENNWIQSSASSFITTWQTTSGNETIIIPTTGAGYDYIVDWGDGTVESGFTGDASHTYATAGTYTVAVQGSFPRIYFNEGNEGQQVAKIQTIEQWGDIVWASMGEAFRGCANLTYTADDAPNLSVVTDLSRMFADCASFDGDLSSWDVSTIEVIGGMFQGATSFNNGGGGLNWNLTNALTTMDYVFWDATSFNQEVSGWDVSSVENFEAVFRGASSFNNGDTPLSWITTSANNMAFMFLGATSFNQDISGWDVSLVQDMQNMFGGASAFNQDLSGWNVNNVTTMARMFEGAASFNAAIGGWSMENVQVVESMFLNASGFDQSLGNWDISSVTDMTGMLNNSGLSTSNYDATLIGWSTLGAGEAQVPTGLSLGAAGLIYCAAAGARGDLVDNFTWTISGDTQDCSVGAFITTWQTTADNEAINIPIGTDGEVYNYTVDWGDGTIQTGLTADQQHTYATAGTYTVSITGTFPRIFMTDGIAPEKLMTIEQWGDIQWTSMREAFKGCTNLRINATDAPDLLQVTSMREMFRFCAALNDPIDHWDVSTITNMQLTFDNCTAFNQDLNSWNMSNVTITNGMFTSAVTFGGNITSWDVSAVTDFGNMFVNADAFNQNIGGWNTSSAIAMNGMFLNNDGFNQDISGWDVSNVTNFFNMFNSTTTSAFNQSLADWDISSATQMTDMLSNSSLSKANYDLTLEGWAFLDAGETQIPTGITLGASGLEYCNGADEREELRTTYSWMIEGDTENCTLDDGLIIYYPFSGNAVDESGNGLDPTSNDGSLGTDRLGNANSAYADDGMGTGLSIVSENDFDLERFTYMSWVKLDDINGDYTFAYFVGAHDTRLISGSLDFFNGSCTPDLTQTSLSSLTTEWHHVAMTFDYQSGLEVFFDGMSINTQSLTGCGSPDASELRIGYLDGADESVLSGLYDEIRLYDRILTSQEIQSIYDAESAGASNEALITSFTIPNQVGQTAIDNSMETILVTMPVDTDVTSLTPTITLSTGATVSPESGLAQDFTNPVTYTVTAEDLIATKAYAVTVAIQTDENNPPTDITLSNNQLSEGLPVNTVIGQFSTVDADEDDVHTYTLVSGTGDTDNGSFNLTSGGELSSNEVFNFDNKPSYAIRVQTDDGGSNGTFEKQFTINILDVTGNAPTGISITSNAIDENNAIDAVIGTFSTIDPDDPESDDNYTYSLVSGEAENFAIDGNNLIAKAVFDAESKSTYTMTIRTLDIGNNSYDSVDFEVTINNVNEAPVLGSFTGTVAENAGQGTVIGSISATDPDGDASLTFSMVDNTSSFEFSTIDGTSANLVVLDNAILDYETRQSLDVQVRVEDAGELGETQTISFDITNVNPQASDLILSNAAIIAGASGGTRVGDLSIAGDEAKSTFIFSIGGGSNDFTIDGNSLNINEGVSSGTYNLTIVAQNNVGSTGITPDQVQNSFEIEVTTVSTSSSVSFGTSVANYRIIGIPTASVQVSAVFPDLTNADQDTKWRIVSYTNGNFSDLNTSSSMTAGKGYWFLSAESTTINLAGLTPIQDSEISITLGADWNLISNPFLESLNMTSAISYNVDQGFIQDGDVGNVFAYNENVVNSLAVLQGGWINNTTGSSLTLILPNPSSTTSGRTALSGGSVEDSWFNDQENWQLILFMHDGARVSNLGAVGMRYDAIKGLDKTDLLAPPLIADELSFRMTDTNGIARNFKPLDESQDWNFSITAPAHERVILSWDSDIVDMLGDELYIYDPANNVSYNMSAINSIELSASASFEVLYGGAVDEASIQVPLLVYPNPASDVVSVQFFAESSNAEIAAKLTIFGIDGRALEEVEQRFAPDTIGRFELNDLDLASGTYFVQVSYDGRNSQPEKLIIR